MRDLRDEYRDVIWQQGVLLQTRTVQRMSAEWRQAASEEEKRGLFAHFSSVDQGRSRVRLWRFETADECATAVEKHNKKLLERQRAQAQKGQ